VVGWLAVAVTWLGGLLGVYELVVVGSLFTIKKERKETKRKGEVVQPQFNSFNQSFQRRRQKGIPLLLVFFIFELKYFSLSFLHPSLASFALAFAFGFCSCFKV
jgi:hypothetical protein